MANTPGLFRFNSPHPVGLAAAAGDAKPARRLGPIALRALVLLGMAVLLAHLVFAQAKPKVTMVDPQAGKTDDMVTLTGENLAKDNVSAVYLSDDTTDFPATVVQQAAEKIVMKVPKVKAGSYNVSIKVGDQIFILPLRFSVQ